MVQVFRVVIVFKFGPLWYRCFRSDYSTRNKKTSTHETNHIPTNSHTIPAKMITDVSLKLIPKQ